MKKMKKISSDTLRKGDGDDDDDDDDDNNSKQNIQLCNI